jgi:hypothetical protein
MRGWGVVAAAVVVVVVMPSCGSSAKNGATGADGGGGGSGAGSGGSASGSGGGGSSGGGSGGGSGSSSGQSTGGASSGGGGACLGASALSALGKSHLIVGANMTAATAAAAPFDLQYQYISGGFSDGAGPCASCATGCTTQGTSCASSGPGCSWWGCWQNDQQAPGSFAQNYVGACAAESPSQLAMFTYYQIFQASGVAQGAPEVTQAATDATFMGRYFADWRFLLQGIGESVALLHIEPDFWGFAEQISEDATSLPAAVASANATDCGSMPNTIAGMGKCMIAMTRKYAPHALVGLHDSAWGTRVTVTANTDATFDVTAPARQTAAFLAACGEGDADFVVVETSDRDAGYQQSTGETNVWWDATNATLPDFHQDFAYVKALTEALNKPALYWQTPLGNTSLPNMNNAWQDNRVDYFFAHMDELAAAHAIGAAFGAGAGGQTTPETDGGNFVTKANAYYGSGGQSLCP